MYISIIIITYLTIYNGCCEIIFSDKILLQRRFLHSLYPLLSHRTLQTFGLEKTKLPKNDELPCLPLPSERAFLVCVNHPPMTNWDMDPNPNYLDIFGGVHYLDRGKSTSKNRERNIRER